MRLFTAIELRDAMKARLAGMAADLVYHRWGLDAPRIKLVPEQNLHVTLKFLGEVVDADVPAVCEALKGVRASGEISLQPGGLEFFPPRGPIRIVAITLDDQQQRLSTLYELIEEVCVGLDIPREGRPYRPHITVARSKFGIPANLRRTETAVPGLGKWMLLVSEFVLMESRLNADRHEYVPIARFGFT